MKNSFLIIVLGVISAQLIIPCRALCQPTYKSGKFVIELYTNGTLDSVFGKNNTFFWQNNYVLEKNFKTSLYNHYENDNNASTAFIMKDSIKYTLENYILTDFNNSECLDSINDNPIILKRYGLSKKSIGMQLIGDIPEVRDQIPNFKFIKDTIINGKKIGIAENNNKFATTNLKDTIIKEIIYIDYNLYNCPFSFISESLKKKFKGLIVKFSVIYLNHWQSNIQFNFISQLTKEEIEQINNKIKFYEISNKNK